MFLNQMNQEAHLYGASLCVSRLCARDDNAKDRFDYRNDNFLPFSFGCFEAGTGWGLTCFIGFAQVQQQPWQL
ncbi:hypothetical protein Syun_019098 [Stephania yunnanensis]|uniref:Uncharacterized protein n=1 Tax=Stephania yunnanensis TaxID=152371 RepID=A0AAP0NZ31_9MAGN